MTTNDGYKADIPILLPGLTLMGIGAVLMGVGTLNGSIYETHSPFPEDTFPQIVAGAGLGATLIGTGMLLPNSGKLRNRGFKTIGAGMVAYGLANGYDFLENWDDNQILGKPTGIGYNSGAVIVGVGAGFAGFTYKK